MLTRDDAKSGSKGKINSLKKVLVVSFSFPPSNNILAVRVGKICKYLPYFDWQPLVLTTSRFEGKRQTSPLEIDEANIFRTPYFQLRDFIKPELNENRAFSPGGQAGGQAALWKKAILRTLPLLRPLYNLPLVRTLLLDPTAWFFYARKKGLEAIAKHNVELIFSTYRPSTSHFIAAYLHKRTGIPWVAEFQDPWALNQYASKTQPFQFMEEQLEKKVIRGSSQLVTVAEPLAERLEAFHGKEVTVVPLGFDEEDYAEDIPLTRKFTITYTGMIYPGKRDPAPLFEAIRRLQQEGKVTPDDFEVRFFGVDNSVIIPLIKRYRLEQLVKLYGFIPFRQSIRKQKESTVLLLLTWNDPREWTYPGKIFEYLGARRPILVSAFKGGAIDSLVTKSGCGIVVNEVAAIKNILTRWLEEFREHGDIRSYYSPVTEIVSAYTQREQAKKLAAVFAKVVNAPGIKIAT